MESAYHCTGCKTDKPATGFSRNKTQPNGLQPHCKDCNRARYMANRDEIIAYKLERIKDNPEQNRVWKQRARQNWLRTEAGKERLRFYSVYRHAIKTGVLVKPDACGDCGKVLPSKKIQGHHADYTKPLQVEWVCAKCHGLRHRTAADSTPRYRRALPTDPQYSERISA